MNQNKIFPKGLIYKKPNPKAPDWVKGTISIKKDEFIDFLNKQDSEWINIDILESKDKTKIYPVLNQWKGNTKSTSF